MTNIISPKGVAKYPWFNKPDTKFDDLGAYKVDLVVPEAEARAFVEKIENAYKAEGLKGNLAQKPWKKEEDDNGDYTGNVVFKFKNQNKAKKDGTIWDRKPSVLDAKLRPIKEVVGGGSTVKIATECYFWNVNGRNGVTLQINGVQVLDLIEREDTASDLGFTVEDGFEAEETNESEVLSPEGEDKDLF